MIDLVHVKEGFYKLYVDVIKNIHDRALTSFWHQYLRTKAMLRIELIIDEPNFK